MTRGSRVPRRRPTWGTILALTATAAVGVGPAAAADGYAPDACRAGKLSCVDHTLAVMQSRFKPQARACSHWAIFSLAYLRTTQMYRQVVVQRGYFQDPAWVNHEDTVFGRLYLNAEDNWAAGRTAQVPAAWRIAFDAADRRTVSAAGDLLLGMNAHVNRDLPFALAEVGIVTPDGRTRKPDHDKVNDFLYEVYGPLMTEEAQRFDPSIEGANIPGTTLDDDTLFQLLVAWREEAWHNAVRLVTAATPAARQAVAASIENAAAAEATAIIASTAYVPPASATTSRDAYCATHWNT